MKIQKSKEIEKELNNATKRPDELTEMRNSITTNLQALQAGFIDGKTSLDELQADQGKLIILNESIKALESKQDELHSAFQKASLSESRSVILKQMKVIADEAETAFNEYVALRHKFGETISKEGEKMFDMLLSFRSKQREFQRAFRGLAPGVDVSRFVPAEARESFNQTRSELEQIGFSDQNFNLITKDYLRLPPIDFAEYVHIIEQAISSKRFKEEQAARKTAKV